MGWKNHENKTKTNDGESSMTGNFYSHRTGLRTALGTQSVVQFPADRAVFLRNGHFNDSPIPKPNRDQRRTSGDEKTIEASRHFLLRSILLWCPASWPCLLFGVSKFSGARNLIQDFFMIFAFVFSFAARFFFFLRSLFGKILFNVHEKAMRSDFITAPRIFGQTAEIKSFRRP